MQTSLSGEFVSASHAAEKTDPGPEHGIAGTVSLGVWT